MSRAALEGGVEGLELLRGDAERAQAGGGERDVGEILRLRYQPNRGRDVRQTGAAVDERSDQRAGRPGVGDAEREVPRPVDPVAAEDRALDVAIVDVGVRHSRPALRRLGYVVRNAALIFSTLASPYALKSRACTL